MIVLDETTYYITAFAVDSNDVVIWTQQATITTEFWWHPSANTFLYYNFDNQNLNDSSWNNRNWSWYSWAWSFTTWIKWYGANNWNRWIKIPQFINWDFTFSIRVNPTNNWLSIQTLFWSVEWSTSSKYIHLHIKWWNNNYIQFALSTETTWQIASDSITWWAWNHIVLTRSWNTWKIYKNKNLIMNFSETSSIAVPINATWLIWNWYNNDRHVQWVFDEVIIETIAWDQDKINKASLYHLLSLHHSIDELLLKLLDIFSMLNHWILLKIFDIV